MFKKLFRRNSYTTAIKKDITDIKAMSKQYEETRKQVLKNVDNQRFNGEVKTWSLQHLQK